MTSTTPAVLVLAPIGRDAQIAASILAANGISTRICVNLEEVLPLLDSAQCLVVAEEALVNSDRSQVANWIQISRHGPTFPSCC